jgi:F0F1-type ATP synthase assembly protein I
MVDLIVVLIALALFAVAAWRWGVDSTDGIESREWLRRRDWPGFGRGAR